MQKQAVWERISLWCHKGGFGWCFFSCLPVQWGRSKRAQQAESSLESGDLRWSRVGPPAQLLTSAHIQRGSGRPLHDQKKNVWSPLSGEFFLFFLLSDSPLRFPESFDNLRLPTDVLFPFRRSRLKVTVVSPWLIIYQQPCKFLEFGWALRQKHSTDGCSSFPLSLNFKIRIWQFGIFVIVDHGWWAMNVDARSMDKFWTEMLNKTSWKWNKAYSEVLVTNSLKLIR